MKTTGPVRRTQPGGRPLWSVALLIFALGAGSFSVAAADAVPEAKSKSKTPAVRVLVLKGTYTDHSSGPEADPISMLFGGLEKPASFFDLCEKIDELARDDEIQHVLIDLSSPTLRMNLAQLSELERHIHKLREAHKRTFAWLENADTVHYTIASACDTVLMTDLGSLDLPSLSLMTLHFRDAMELLGAKASFVRTGDFKGAVEPFTLSEMSEPLRAHYKEMLVSMNDALVEQICAGRKLNREQLRRIQSDRLFTPSAAVAAELVDGVVPFGTSRASVARLIGQEVSWVEPPKSGPKQLSFFELMGRIMGGAQERRANKPAVAVLHLDGQIVDGERDLPDRLVSGPTVKAIRELESDENVRAVVARINSPGGSATASEAIRAALEGLAAKKPLVVSMGNMAASGGYWISCLGRPVYAEPETLTGSIGVFALKLSFGTFLKKIGIKMESVTLDESAGAMAPDRGWTPNEEQRMQGLVNDIYDRFLNLVAKSRKLKTEQVSPIAGGRVWSGVQAQKLGLVDTLGGMDEALAAVAREAGLDPGYDVIHRPGKKNFFEVFDLFDESTDNIRSALSPAAAQWLREAGFDLSVPLQLVRESLSGRVQSIWLLAPTELVIR